MTASDMDELTGEGRDYYKLCRRMCRVYRKTLNAPAREMYDTQRKFHLGLKYGPGDAEEDVAVMMERVMYLNPPKRVQRVRGPRFVLHSESPQLK